MECFPFEFYLRDQIFPLAGIGGVATFPEHRGKNYVHHLLSESLKISREKGLIYSMLYPFSFEYYRIFEWEMAGFQRRYIRKLVSIPKFKEMDYVKRGDWKSLKIFEEIYEKYAKNFTGMLKRNSQRWERLFSSQSPFTYRRFSSFYSSKSQRRLLYRAYFHAKNCRFRKGSKKLNFPKDLEGKINIEVRNEYAKENDGIWEIEIKEGKASIEKGDKKDISIGINILSQIFAGVLTPKKPMNMDL